MAFLKKLKALRNSAGGFDLATERDAGNEVLILTGKPERSLEYWQRLKTTAEAVITELKRPPEPPAFQIEEISILHP